MFKVNKLNTRTSCEICSELKIKTPGVVLASLLLTLNFFIPRSSVSIVNFEHVIAGWDFIKNSSAKTHVQGKIQLFSNL